MKVEVGNAPRMIVAAAACLLLASSCGDKGEKTAAGAAPSPAPQVRIAAEDCKVGIDVSPKGPFTIRAGTAAVLPLTVTVTNRGRATWGAGGPDVQLGAVWFPADKVGAAHDPNFGEARWGFPAALPAGGSVKFDVNLDASQRPPGDYQVWLSALQPAVMWCFHVGDPPAKLMVSIKPPEASKGK